MISKTLGIGEIDMLVRGLKGDGQNGLAYKQLPVQKVVFPLLRFVEDASAILKPFEESRRRLAQQRMEAKTEEEKTQIDKEYGDLLMQEYDMRLMPICQACLNDREDLSLSDLQILSYFFPKQDPEEPVVE